MNDENMEMVHSVIGVIGAAAMMFGGVCPYIPQYREIKKSQSAEGFSLYVCLALLLANTLRILFWFGHPFEMPLLAQSIIMNITMLAMIRLCVQFNGKSQIIKAKDHLFTDFEVQHFWAWTDFTSYVECLATFSVVGGIFVYLFLDVSWFVETVGFLAVFTEAMLGVPQFYRNYKNQSTEGMSKQMVGMWTLGDIFKTAYFIMRESPVQFWICGMLQVCIDIVILGQVILYRGIGHQSMKPRLYIS